MTETSTSSNPNVDPHLKQQHEASLLVSAIMKDPQSLGASSEDGSYTTTKTEHGTSEEVTLASNTGLTLTVLRQREHDPARHAPGKTAESIIVNAYIGDAQAMLHINNGKVVIVEYSDENGKKTDIDGLADAVATIELAVEELKLVSR